MPAGYTATPIPITIVPNTEDLTAANDDAGPGKVTTVWTMPRDFERDMQAVLKAIFTHYAITDVPILINGVFEASMLRAPDPADPTNVSKGTIVPVITMNLSSDVATRTALGEVVGNFAATDPRLLDGIVPFGDPNAVPPVAPLIPQVLDSSQYTTLKNQASKVSLDMSIYCLNEDLGRNTYLFVKTALFATESAFTQLGYLEPPLRTSASRSTGILDLDGGPKFLYEWQMTYEAMHYDFIAGIDSLASLIAIRSDVLPTLDPDGLATQTVILAKTD